MDFFADIVNKSLELRKESGETKVNLQKISGKKGAFISVGWWEQGGSQALMCTRV